MNPNDSLRRAVVALPVTMTALFLMLATGACKNSPPVDDDGSAAQSTVERDGSGSADQVDDALSDAPTEAPASGLDPSAGNVDVVAVVNGDPIPMADFQQQAFDTQRYHVDQGGIDPNTEDGQQQLLVLRRGVLRDMIDQQLMAQAAVEMNITVSDDELEADMKGLIAEVGGQAAFARKLAEAQTSKDTWMEVEWASLIGRKVLDAITADLPKTAEFVHARQIYCRQQADCESALVRLDQGEDFAAVAKEMSEDISTKEQGGDLDWITRGSLLSTELEAVVFTLQSGQRSGVAASDLGFHIVEVLERDPARAMSDEQLMPLREKKLTEWLTERRSASDIEIMVDDLKDLAANKPGSND